MVCWLHRSDPRLAADALFNIGTDLRYDVFQRFFERNRIDDCCLLGPLRLSEGDDVADSWPIEARERK
jgi:hypothetical protein